MKATACDGPIVRASLLLPFRGSEIWCIELDGLGANTCLAMEKFAADIAFAQRPSTTSVLCVHLRTCLVSFHDHHFGKFYCLFGLSSSPGESPLSSSAPKIQQNYTRKRDHA